MPTYFTAPSIEYYRINENNTGIAQTNLGSGNPTEKIEPPLNAGIYSSFNAGTKEVTGNNTSTFESWEPNMYLYYIDSGDYKLVGQIASITDDEHLILTAAPVNSTWASGVSVLSASYSLITTGESIYIRIQTVGSPIAPNGRRYIPNFGLNYWRIGNGLTGTNKETQSYLEQVSAVGSPLSNAPAVTKIPFTFVTMNQFQVASSGTSVKYWTNSGSLPLYVWIRVTPQIGSSTSLNSQTLYRFVTQEYMVAFEAGPLTDGQALRDAGYNNVSVGTGTAGETGGTGGAGVNN